MKYLQSESFLGGNDNECSDDAISSTKLVEIQLDDLKEKIDALDSTTPLGKRLTLATEYGYTLLQLNRFEEAWQLGRSTLNDAVAGDQWLQAVESCDIMFQTEQSESIKALAHGIWLSVTFPVDPELSVAMLQHFIDDTPDRSDGAAVAAVTAGYIVNLRADDEQRDSLRFFTNQLLGQVARRHSQIEEQEIFDFWVQQLELDDPEKFLPRLAQVLDLLTADDWWFDRDSLREKIPD
ncbi:MAG: hypothetical protein ABW166_01245 [Sedimenticola sp.]